MFAPYRERRSNITVLFCCAEIIRGETCSKVISYWFNRETTIVHRCSGSYPCCNNFWQHSVSQWRIAQQIWGSGFSARWLFNISSVVLSRICCATTNAYSTYAEKSANETDTETSVIFFSRFILPNGNNRVCFFERRFCIGSWNDFTWARNEACLSIANNPNWRCSRNPSLYKNSRYKTTSRAFWILAFQSFTFFVRHTQVCSIIFFNCWNNIQQR